MKIGASIPVGMSVREAADCAKKAEELGFDSIWANDSTAEDVFAMLAAIAIATEKIRIGSGVVNVFSRRPVTLALAAATIDEISRGRFIFGIGPSHRPVVEQRFDMKFANNLARMKEGTEIIRRLVEGETLTYEGKVFRINNFKMGFRAYRQKLPIYFGVVGPKMLELAGEAADGLYMNVATPVFVSEARKKARAAQSRPSFEVASSIMCNVSLTEDRAGVDAVKKGIAAYARLPSFNRAIADGGYEKEARAIAGAWTEGNGAKAAALVTDSLMESCALVGTPDDCIAQLDKFASAGLDLPVLTVPNLGEETGRRFLSMLEFASKWM